MRVIFTIFMVVISFISCKRTAKAPTYDLPIPREKLVSVLTDIYLAESALIEYENGVQDSIRKMFITEIFTIQGIDKSLFDTTWAQLSLNPELYREIHTQVSDSIKVTDAVEPEMKE